MIIGGTALCGHGIMAKVCGECRQIDLDMIVTALAFAQNYADDGRLPDPTKIIARGREAALRINIQKGISIYDASR